MAQAELCVFQCVTSVAHFFIFDSKKQIIGFLLFLYRCDAVVLTTFFQIFICRSKSHRFHITMALFFVINVKFLKIGAKHLALEKAMFLL